MRKIMLAAMAALAITGCSQSEEFDAPISKKEIGFTSAVTRAPEMDLALLKTAHFKVYSYNTEAEVYGTGTLNKIIMNGVEVKYDTKWTYDGSYYWPVNAAKVQFFAYAPFTSTAASYSAAASSTDPTITYTVPTVEAQEDFVIAKATDKDATVQDVALSFRHALTQVNFSIQGEDAATYTVSKIEINGVANVGILDFSNISWTEATGIANYNYPLGTTKAVTGTDAVKLDQEGKALMLLPQVFAVGSSAKLVVSYTVTDSNNNNIYTAIDKEIPLANTKAWTASNKMRYTLKLTNDARNITFGEPVFEPWGEEGQETGTTPKP